MKRETIKIKEDVKLPGTDIVLEKGDRIQVIDKKKLDEQGDYLLVFGMWLSFADLDDSDFEGVDINVLLNAERQVLKTLSKIFSYVMDQGHDKYDNLVIGVEATPDEVREFRKRVRFTSEFRRNLSFILYEVDFPGVLLPDNVELTFELITNSEDTFETLEDIL